jgi:hypothetical protein
VKPANYGPFYAAGLYPKLAEIFREHGYALAVHGSVGTDFDLIAVPWREENVSDPDIVIGVLFERYDFKRANPERVPTPEVKAHGRVAYSLHLSFDTCYLDISFTPRTGKRAKPRRAKS